MCVRASFINASLYWLYPPFIFYLYCAQIFYLKTPYVEVFYMLHSSQASPLLLLLPLFLPPLTTNPIILSSTYTRKFLIFNPSLRLSHFHSPLPHSSSFSSPNHFMSYTFDYSKLEISSPLAAFDTPWGAGSEGGGVYYSLSLRWKLNHWLGPTPRRSAASRYKALDISLSIFLL